jgi:phage terminase large subunit-like protein
MLALQNSLNDALMNSRAERIRLNLSIAQWLAKQPKPIRTAIIRSFKESQLDYINWDWRFWGRPSQLRPGTAGAQLQSLDWRFWLVLAGRGFGKTRVGAETCRGWAEDKRERILLVGPTASDVRDTMIEGPSGLLACYPPGRKPIYNPSRHRITFPSGAIGITRSADEPERLRGPQFTKFWGDELCAWFYAKEAWDQIMFGFRVKTSNLQGVITTTPKPIDTLRKLLANAKSIVTRGSSYENRANLSDDWYADVIEPYEGTRIGRQEIEGEVLEDTPGAQWTQAVIDGNRIERIDMPPLIRVVVAIDPAVTASETSDETGIGAAGIAANGHVYVLEDASCKESPAAWARVACRLMLKWDADRIVAEVNNGGDLVERNIRAVLQEIPFRSVRATRGKLLRAEPVAAMYERGRVHHVGRNFEQLELQQTTWVPGAGMKSPDRLDWLVWAVTDLALDPAPQTAIATADIGRVISPY